MAFNPNNIEQIGTDIYADSPKTDSSDFGAIHKMSRDGKTIIASKLLSPYRNSDNFDDDGRVIIYELSGGEWVPTGFFDGDHRDDSPTTTLDSKLGAYVDISDDGNRAVAFASAAPVMDNISDTAPASNYLDYDATYGFIGSEVMADIEGDDVSDSPGLRKQGSGSDKISGININAVNYVWDATLGFYDVTSEITLSATQTVGAYTPYSYVKIRNYGNFSNINLRTYTRRFPGFVYIGADGSAEGLSYTAGGEVLDKLEFFAQGNTEEGWTSGEYIQGPLYAVDYALSNGRDGIFNWISNGQYNFNGYIEIYDKSESTWSSSQKIYIEDVFQNRISTTSPESIGLEIRSLCLSGDGNTLAFIANYWSGNPEPISPQDDGLYKNFEIHIWKKNNGSFTSSKVLQSNKAGLADITSAFLDSPTGDYSTIDISLDHLPSDWDSPETYWTRVLNQMQTAFDFDDVNYTDQLNLNYDGSSFILGMPNGPGFIDVQAIKWSPLAKQGGPYDSWSIYVEGPTTNLIGMPGRWGEVHIYKDDDSNNWNRTGAFFGSQNNSEAGSTTAINKNGNVIAFGNAPNFNHIEDVPNARSTLYGIDPNGFDDLLDDSMTAFYGPHGGQAEVFAPVDDMIDDFISEGLGSSNRILDPTINTDADTSVRIFKWNDTLQKWIIRGVLAWSELVMPNDPGGFNRLAASVSSIDMDDSGDRVVIGLSTNNDLGSDIGGLNEGDSGDVVLLYDWNDSTNQYDLKHAFRPASAEGFYADICAFGHQVYLSGDGKTLSIANPMVATDLRDSTQEFGMLGPGYWGGLGDNSSEDHYGHIEVYTLGKDSFSRLGETETTWYLGSSAVTAAYLGDTKLL